MQAGQTVVCVKDGNATDAVIESLASNGPSGYKRLNLLVDGERLEDVPHEGDAACGAFWAFDAPQRSAGKRSAGKRSR